MSTTDYMIVLDLDGTLLNKHKKIPFFTKRYLINLSKKGYTIILASGRPARNIKKFADELKINTPIIALNGLHIHYPTHQSDDQRIYFPPDKIIEITNKISESFAINNIICETDKEIYITNKNAYLEPKFWLVNMKVEYGTLIENLKHPVMTFLMEMKNPDFNQNELKKMFINTNYNVRCWVGKYQGYIEIFNEHSNKARAIREIASERHINLNHVYAFGDDLNDIEMILDIPNSYTMKNAKNDIKKISKHITSYDNNHQGVMRELKIILKHLK